MRAAADLEMQQVVNEVRRQVEKEKEIAIAETKRKKWVRYRHTPCPRKCVVLPANRLDASGVVYVGLYHG